MQIPRFDWDPEKAESNRRKHGVSFTEAASAFADLGSVTVYDFTHSDEEDRELLIGHSSHGRLIVVCHTYRRGVFRIISARKPTRIERRTYEEKNA